MFSLIFIHEELGPCPGWTMLCDPNVTVHCTFTYFCQKLDARTVYFRTGRLTRNCFHRFLCLIGSTASYKTNADQDTFCARDTD